MRRRPVTAAVGAGIAVLLLMLMLLLLLLTSRMLPLAPQLWGPAAAATGPNPTALHAPGRPGAVLFSTSVGKGGGVAAVDLHIDVPLGGTNTTRRRTVRVRVRLRPDLSPSSTAWMQQAAAAGCGGQLYRSEDFLVQGVIRCDSTARQPTSAVAKGRCPPGVLPLATGRTCPPHDPQCGCHGPVMTPGMMAWAGGGVGPDWFVYTGTGPATYWSHDHTVIGEVAPDDATSWATLAALRGLPASSVAGGMRMLASPCGLTVGRAA